MKRIIPLLAMLGLLVNLTRASSVKTGEVASSLCPGTSISISFTAMGNFSIDNVFTAQLSDAGGSFTNPTVIGSLTGTSSGVIIATIPANTEVGMFYKIRVVNSGVVDSVTDNGSYITIEAIPQGPALNASGSCLGNETLHVSGSMGVNTLQIYFNDSVLSQISNSSYAFSTVAGGNGAGDDDDQLTLPYGVFVDGPGNLYVADPSNSRVLKFPPGSNSSSYGVIVAGGNGPGYNANQLDGPYFIFVDNSGNLYVSDYYNNRVQKFPPGSDSTTEGVTIAGGNGYGGDYNQIAGPRGIYVDGTGVLYVADKFNNRVMKFPAGSSPATDGVLVAGGYISGNAGNQLNAPRGIWLDANSNLYVADYLNSRVQMFPPGSDSTTFAATVAGGNGYGSDSDQLSTPYGVYVDALGNLFVVDVYNNRVQEFPAGSNHATNGITVAGGNGLGDDVDQLYEPTGISVDGSGNIYIADYGNNRIQKASPYIADTTFTPLLPGNYSAAYFSNYGCISPTSGEAVVSSFSASTISQTICSGESYLGRNATGVYVDTFTNVAGCDSLRTLNLTVNASVTTNLTQTICAGESYLGRSATGVYVDTLTGYYGCDSIRTLNLTVNPTLASGITQTICYGESYLGRSTSGIYIDTLTGFSGCDSIRSLNLTVTAALTSRISQSICTGESYLGKSATGVYVDTLTGFNGCDSIRTLNLTVNPPLSSGVNQAICFGESYSGRTVSGVYVDTLTGSNGCDSVVTLNLTVNPVNTSSYNQNICSGTSYMFNGHELSAAGNYTDTLTSLLGCDSLITLSLFVDSVSTPAIFRSGNILYTDTFAAYTWLLNDSVITGGNQQSLAIEQNGNYRIVVTSSSGCTDTSSVFSVLDLGIGNLVATGEVKLYPDPNNGIFMLGFMDELARDVEITDALGRNILSIKVGKQQQFDLPQLSGGIYFIRFTQASGFETLKFSVVK